LRAAQTAAETTGRTADVTFSVANASLAMADDHVRKLIHELVDNACKFSAAGTPIEISGEPAGDHYRLAITDRGRGLKPEQIAAVGAYMQFDRRLHEQQGSGLGLAIAQRLARLYDGDLLINSEYGSGTTVTVTLPLARSE
jgi:two-component system sensor histidine kinase/response regulator